MTEGVPGAGRGQGARALVVYTGARFAIFLLSLTLLLVAGLRGVVVLFAALVISGIASYLLLGRQRTAVGAALERRVESRRAARAAAQLDED
jgi:hypothetical protein